MKIEKMYLEIINNLPDGIYFVSPDREILFWNKAAEKITGYTAEEIIGKRCQDSGLNHIDQAGRPLCMIACPLFETLVDGEQRRAKVFVRHKEGYRIPISVNILPIREGGKIAGAVEIFTQSSPAVYEDDLVEHLADLAMHDSLTKLPNRRYLESFLEYKISEYMRFGRLFAVLMGDIDNFRYFNNNYGHEAGDKVLLNIAATIKRNMRRDDLIGRWGGEEFVGIYSVGKPEDGAIIGEKFRQMVLHTELPYGGTVLTVSMSIGVTAIRPNDTAVTVMNRVDELMYHSKRTGKNCVTADR
ncbi:MAG: sensor domain-containing diguanylate cyclase [Clostridium sp.]|nr:sensor domain-containing diguanylate cyclase [Clostridium sp.]